MTRSTLGSHHNRVVGCKKVYKFFTIFLNIENLRVILLFSNHFSSAVVKADLYRPKEACISSSLGRGRGVVFWKLST